MYPYLSPVHVSFEKFRSLHPSYLEDDLESSDEDDVEEEGDYSLNLKPHKNQRRSKGVPVGMVTKHNAEVCGRRNVKNMEKFPPDFPAGDLNEKGQDYRLSNSVFNTLKLHSQKEEKHVSQRDTLMAAGLGTGRLTVKHVVVCGDGGKWSHEYS